MVSLPFVWTVIAKLSLVLALMGAMIPDPPLAAAWPTAVALASEKPLESRRAGDEIRDAAYVVAIEWHESRFDNDAVSATQDYCLMQVNRRPDLRNDAVLCVREGMRWLRWSIRACRKWPFAAYAEGPGGCESERARRLSQEMSSIAKRMVESYR